MKAWWLRHALTPKPQPSDTRSFIVRLASSLRLSVKGSWKKGITFFGLHGGVKF